MLNYWASIVVAVAILVLAIPLVARVRHPEQKPLAAYLIFVFVFAAASFVLFNVLGWLAARAGLGPVLDNPGPTVAFLVLVFLPALGLAVWQARKPPSRHGLPH